MTVELLRDGPRLTDPAAVGNKFARQAELRAAGFRVPEFFCVPVEAFDAALARAAAEDPADRRRVLSRGGVPEPLAGRLLAAFDELAGPDGVVAVRACVVGDGEDSAADPFAGMSDSFLNVGREALLARVAECWASAFTDRAVAYRRLRGADPGGARVAVGVQRMVPAARSFVAFSRDPRTGAAHHLVAAAYGLGEGVVQELADVDHFAHDPATGRVTRTVVPKHRMVAPDPARAGEPRVTGVPAGLRAAPVLTDAEVRAIGALAARVAAHFGAPQDIEGALTADGTIELVQARPIVFAGDDPAPASGVLWTNHNLTESFPGVTCALTYSQAQEFYEVCFRGFYRRIGVPARRLDRHAGDLARMIGLLDGRVYYQLDAWYRLHALMPGWGQLRPTWQRTLGLSGDELDDAPPLPRHGWLTTLRALPRAVASLLGHPLAVRRFLTWWDDLAAATGPLDGVAPEELVRRYRRIWAEFVGPWPVTLLNGYFLLVGLTVTQRLLARWTDGDPALLVGLLPGGPENRSLLALRSALRLATRLRRDPRLAAALADGTDREVHDAIVGGRFGSDVAEAFAEHLRRYGDRTVHDLKLEVRTPRQDPWRLIGVLRPLVASGETAEGNRAAERNARRDGVRRLRRACPSPARRIALGLCVRALRRFVKAREDTRLCRSQLYGVSRDILYRLGAVLAADGRLADAGDVVHLRVDEVLGAIDGTGGTAGLADLAARRRAELEAWREKPAPPAYLSPDGPGRDAARSGPAPGDVLRGLASSRGVVRARAAVVLDPTAPVEDCRDRILVARETDPGWLYLMTAAKGIVVERGSLLSHTAITGRLLGIPTVVAVPGATTAIADGGWIELDGAAGTVRLLRTEEVA
ncbi:PEP/pyruvate-binding domain-containing protein [Amycolatopsis solani]|uniref:PEP/pyruvate-binding domain-containing protein n=1 Tax=Amycolatopsis solani TaxID=3028615 RepID=UPI0025B1DB54|nr:PEP/pyruvate-binding domain-containing protein [Amycolatopsis sp. MEP2-6]